MTTTELRTFVAKWLAARRQRREAAHHCRLAVALRTKFGSVAHGWEWYLLMAREQLAISKINEQNRMRDDILSADGSPRRVRKGAPKPDASQEARAQFDVAADRTYRVAERNQRTRRQAENVSTDGGEA